jgi:hypothetical protein
MFEIKSFIEADSEGLGGLVIVILKLTLTLLVDFQVLKLSCLTDPF